MTACYASPDDSANLQQDFPVYLHLPNPWRARECWWNGKDAGALVAQEVQHMPRFITIGYGDEAGYQRTATNIRNAAHAHDDELKQNGTVMGMAGAPVQVRNPEARGVQTEQGAFLNASLPIAGFALIEAADLAEAIDLASRSPCAVAHGVVEVWPLQEVAP